MSVETSSLLLNQLREATDIFGGGPLAAIIVADIAAHAFTIWMLIKSYAGQVELARENAPIADKLIDVVAANTSVLGNVDAGLGELAHREQLALERRLKRRANAEEKK